METSLDYKSFVKLVKLVLENEYKTSLREDFILSENEKIVFDLMNLEDEIFVEILSQQKRFDFLATVNKIRFQNYKISSKTRSSLRMKQILVTQNKLNTKEKIKLKNILGEELIKSRFIIYDVDDIFKIANKYNINSLNDDTSELSVSNNVLNKLLLSIEDESIFLGGHIWDGIDQIERFLSDGIWENGHDTLHTEIVNQAAAGDILFVKSTYAQNGISYLRIKGIGVITQNLSDGHALKVDWSLFKKNIDIPHLGSYRRTFEKVKEKDRYRILESILEAIPSFYEALLELRGNIIQIENESNEIPIDKEATVLFGQRIGLEIRKYNILFLPITHSEIVERKTLTSTVLETLGIRFEEVKFDISKLEENGYQWMDFVSEMKEIRICFFVVTTINQNKRTKFKESLDKAIKGFKGVLKSNHKGVFNSTLFIGLFDGSMDSPNLNSKFEIINKLLSTSFRDKFKPKLIRLQFPNDISKEQIKKYAKSVLKSLKLKENTSYFRDETTDRIPFHLDNVETIDKLNREPVAKSLARLINTDIFNQKEMDHSFMVHLQGEWGSGKSTFLNLIKKHLNTKDRKWGVIEYNAWQNQHLTPPWWSFIDQIYIQGKQKLHWFKKRPVVRAKEILRRWIWYSAWHKITSFGIFLFLLLVLFINYETIFETIGSIAKLGDSTTNADLLKFILSFGSIIGLVFSLSKFISTPLAIKSSEQAKRFTLRASDPMNRIKKHFNNLIADFNKQNLEIAVFIDDIDRCNRGYTIELLEGIQTLFKDRRVLYIVAGDAQWITSCFENNYKEFTKVATNKRHNLGELFLEKAFQLSIRMPDVSAASKEAYWKEIIGVPDKRESKDFEKDDYLSNQLREKIKQRMVVNYNQNENSAKERSNIVREFNISQQQATNIAIEALDENTEDVKHLLLSFHNLISPNPRSIKRLANNYTMYRNTLIAEQVDFRPSHLFRWLLLEDKYPRVVKNFLKRKALGNLEEINFSKEYSKLEIDDIINIVNGRHDMNENKLTIEELNQILRK